MKRQRSISKVLSLVLIIVTVFWLRDIGQGQEVKPKGDPARADGQASLVVQLGHTGKISSVSFSSDGKYALTSSYDEKVLLWETATGREVRAFVGHLENIEVAAFSADDKYVLTGSSDCTARFWRTETGKEIRKFVGHSKAVKAIACSIDGKYVLTGSLDKTARLWETKTGKEVRQFVGHSNTVWSAAFSADGRYALTTSSDTTVRLWNVSSGTELCRLISFRDGNWIVVAPDGRFDTSNLEEIKGLHWIMSDEPMRTYPLEIFTRDYYEPRLLARILDGEKFKPIPSIATLNRARPEVTIVSGSRQKDNPDLVSISVKVSKGYDEFKQGDKTITRTSDVYDLRLFRDGQLVAQSPQFNPATRDAATQPDATPEQMRNVWREQARVKLDASGEQTITFKNIHLPRRADTKQVEFTAYAFNEDRVKSQTDRKIFDLPTDLAPVKGRAFLLTVGVNAYENRAWNLRYAVNDARLAGKTLSEGLRQSGEFAEVVNISLISDAQPAADAKPATKAGFKAALEDVARRARPEDLVMIYYSSHGYADRRGLFYLFPSDIGAGTAREITPQLLDRLISSDELSAWLKDVDAGEMVMVIDACQSAGTVKGEEGGEFKPGPMGSRGLGQLAYDKGMRILAASQADDFAFEADRLQHGLLSYALLKDGLGSRKADNKPKDDVLSMTEWLEYGERRVPVLYEAMRKNELGKLFRTEGGRGPVVTGQAASLRKKNSFQKPSLFDFAKKRKEVILTRSVSGKR